MKVLLVLAPVGLIVMVYALTQSDWCRAVNLAFIEFVIFMVYRAKKRNRASASEETMP